MNEMWSIVSGGGALGLAVVFLYLFQTGKVRSEKQLTETVGVYVDVIKHKDREIEWWRDAYRQQSLRGDNQEAVNREQLEFSKAALAALEGVQEAAKRVQP